MKNRRRRIIHLMTLREIRGTFGRFFAIFAIIALGVGFFSGIRITTPVMVHTVDKFYNEHHFFDYRAVSTLGYEEEDVERLRQENDALFAEGAHARDVILENENGDTAVYRVLSLTKEINTLFLREGRMPENAQECVIDADNRMGYEIGDTVRFSEDNAKDTLEAFAAADGRGAASCVYTVVGFADSPLYINFERGTTPVGNGMISGFLYLTEEAFAEEYYTEVYIKLDTEEEIYSDAYKDRLKEGEDRWEEAVQMSADDRYGRLRTDAEKELSDAKDEFAEKKADGEKELADARQELRNAKQELDDAETELRDGKTELDDGEKKLRDGKKELDDADEKLAEAKAQLDDAKEELDSGKKKLDDSEKELERGKKQLDDSKKTLDTSKKQLDETEEQLSAAGEELAASEKKLTDGKRELDETEKQLTAAKEELEASEKELDAAKAELDANGAALAEARAELDSTKETLAEAKAELDKNASALEEAKAVLDANEDALAEAKAELDANGAALAETKAALDEAETNLQAVKAQLDEEKAKLDAAEPMVPYMDEETKAAYEAGKAQYEAGLAEYNAGKAQYDAGLAEYSAGEAQYEAGLAQYTEGKTQYDAGLAEYNAGKAQYDAGLAEYNAGMTQYEAGLAQYTEGKTQYEAGLAQYSAGKAQYEAGLAQYTEGKAQYETGLSEYEKGKAEYDAGKAAYDSGKEQFEAGRARYEEGKARYEAAYAQYESGRKQYEAGKAEYESGKSAYESGRSEYLSGLAEAEKGRKEYEENVIQFEDAKREYDEGVLEYEDGLRKYREGLFEYEDGKLTFDREIADAELKIADAEQELDDFEEPDTYLLGRGTNIGYASFESDSEIVRQIARVFPLFFILVAVLVCMTTMTRMVEEQRGQIGILKGLGYSEGDIFGTFIAYSGTASVLGCVFGYGVGIFIFPAVIWTAYKMMYLSLPIEWIPDVRLAAAVLAVSVLCSVGTTYWSLRSELKESAASLMRPRAPQAGKRVLLERIPWLWNRLKFMHKISARNILRYKKRFFMMVIGISGCTALLITGFGIKDSIASFATTQYGEIQTADAQVIFKNGSGGSMPDELAEVMNETGAEQMTFNASTWDLLVENGTKGVNVIAPFEPDRMDAFFRLRSLDGEALSVPGKGEALISVSLAQRQHLAPGDTIRLRNENMREMTLVIGGIFENHVYNYVILSPESILEVTGEADANAAYVNFREGADVYEAQKTLAECEQVTSVSIYRDFMVRLTKMMESLNYIVIVVILSAAALALVVLYNLTNINILERIREIATIKVLGFYPKETADYVFRENIVLTAFGVVLGLVLGIFLHRFVMAQIVVDMVYFNVTIRPFSFVISVLLTFLFTVIVNLLMSIRIEKINMAESLKSVE